MGEEIGLPDYKSEIGAGKARGPTSSHQLEREAPRGAYKEACAGYRRLLPTAESIAHLGK
jgi:hypothetical protein